MTSQEPITPADTTQDDWLDDILTNYEFQIIAMDGEDTGAVQKAEAKAAITSHYAQQLVEAEQRGYERGRQLIATPKRVSFKLPDNSEEYLS